MLKFLLPYSKRFRFDKISVGVLRPYLKASLPQSYSALTFAENCCVVAKKSSKNATTKKLTSVNLVLTNHIYEVNLGLNCFVCVSCCVRFSASLKSVFAFSSMLYAFYNHLGQEHG